MPSIDTKAPPYLKPHDWFEFNGMTCCRSCGYVRNATSDTRPCKGPVKVELRPSPEGEANG